MKTPRNSKATPNVRYVRNLNHMEQSSDDLMSDTLPTNYLYSKIQVGEQATHFFTETMMGADFDLRLRERYAKGTESLLAANPHDAQAVAAAQLECLTVISIYDMLASQFEQAHSCREQLKLQPTDDMEEGE